MKVWASFTAAFLTAILLLSTGAVPAGQSAAPGLDDQGEGIIRGVTYGDLNKNGIYDFGESWVDGTVVCLVGYNWCDHTEWGEFMFDMLYPGTYQLEVTDVPEGYYVTSANPATVLPEGFYVEKVDFALSTYPESIYLPHVSR